MLSANWGPMAAASARAPNLSACPQALSASKGSVGIRAKRGSSDLTAAFRSRLGLSAAGS